MQRKTVLNSPRLDEFKKKRQKAYRNKIILFSFIILIILAGLSFASRLPKININEVNISGNKITDTEAMKNIVTQDLNGHYLWFFPKTNFFIYPKNKIKHDLTDNFKRLKNISLSIKNGKTLEVTVSEYEGKYLWCGTAVPEIGDNSNQKCYFIDSDGYIFNEAPYFSGDVYFRFYGLVNLNGDDPSGNFFSPSLFSKLILFKETLEKIGLKPVMLSISDNNDIEMYLSASNSASVSPKIIFKSDSDFTKVAENLQTAITSEDLVSDFKNKFSSLLYIDLRFGNKVYYKFK